MIAPSTVYIVFAVFGLILSLIPLRWHLESWNVGTCMFMIWTALGCLVGFVDAIVWNGNVVNWAPVWCDIAIRVKVGTSVGLPACAFCIVRRLYHITVQTARSQKLRAMIVDLSITIGIPVSQMVIQYIVATNRFDIAEDFGCTPAISNTSLSYVLVFSWPLIIAVISACYGALTIRTFIKKRKQFKDFLKANGNSTYVRCWRLIALASVDFCFTIPLCIRSIIASSLPSVSPWVSWAHTHSGYSHVYKIPRIVLEQHPLAHSSYEVTRWTPILCAFLSFGFFGFTGEAKRNYRSLASTIAKFLGFTVFAERTSTPGSRVTDQSLHFALPVPITQQTVPGSDSDSFSDITGNWIDPEILCPSPAKQSAFASSTLSIEEVPRVPEPVLDSELVRRPSVPDAPTFVHLGYTLDRM